MAIAPTFDAAMLVLLSPSKTMASDAPSVQFEPSQPVFLQRAELLMSTLKKMGIGEIEALMKVSRSIAEDVQERCSKWSVPFTEENAMPAAYGFKGAVYTGLDTRSWTTEDMEFAQGHLRILSGLYGLLGPKDYMQPYRLEMGLKWPNTPENKNLYSFWGSELQLQINQQSQGLIVDLASQEYSKAAQLKSINQRVITPVFKDLVKGEYKALMAYAKQARGAMAKFIIQNQIINPEEMKGFEGMGYQWDALLSEGDTWLFTRDKNSIAS